MTDWESMPHEEFTRRIKAEDVTKGMSQGELSEFVARRDRWWDEGTARKKARERRETVVGAILLPVVVVAVLVAGDIVAFLLGHTVVGVFVGFAALVLAGWYLVARG